jgi:L-aspartate oxidase
MPVAPAAHYHMGGAVVDHFGRTTVEGLWACGEVAHTGLHGANRLASNSLLEALVFGARVGDRLTAATPAAPEVASARAALRNAQVEPADQPWLADSEPDLALRIREIMWSGVGLERTASGLQLALWELGQLEREAPQGIGELRNLLTVARLVARAAWARTESRGSHFRSDVPWRDPHWQQQLYFEGGRMIDPQPIAVAG